MPDDAATPTDARARPRLRRAAGREDQLLDAAIAVFARKGFHSTRVSEIASHAGVAHGLVYHYFPSKESLLVTIFHRTWAQLVQGLERIEATESDARSKLADFVRLMLGSYRLAPDLVRVLILEVTRSEHLRGQIDELQEAFRVLERVIDSGQRSGELRSKVSPALGSYLVWGALDEVLTGWVVGAIPDDDASIAEAERSLLEFLCSGLCIDDGSETTA